MSQKVFNPENRKKLNNPERLEWLPPKKIVEFIHSEKSARLIDIGAGTAYITQEIEKLLPHTEILAFDISPVMIEEMKTTLPAKSKIKPVLMEESMLSLEDNSVDVAMAITLYHELPEPELFLKEVKRVLKPSGKLLIIDWEKTREASERGPSYEHRVATNDIVKHFEKAGYNNIQVNTEFTHHIGILGSK